jgi:NADPH2:quinone reductase
MRAVMFVPRPGGASVEVADVPKPEPAAGEVLVRVRAAGLNRGEMSIRRGLTSGALQQTGIEFAGEVAACGAGAKRFKPGERVMGHWRGGQAEFVAADERLLVPVPPRLSWIEAGAC